MWGDDRWDTAIETALGIAPTPFFLISTPVFRDRLIGLCQASAGGGVIRTRHWYSYKTLPIPDMAVRAIANGMGVEVVSPGELHSVLRLGVQPQNILVNGIAKHTWGDILSVPRINIIFDSLHEITLLANRIADLNWNVGLRYAVRPQVDPGDRRYRTQFGMTTETLRSASRMLASKGVLSHFIHFHLQSDVDEYLPYIAAMEEVFSVLPTLSIPTSVLDVGGGLPDDTLGPSQDGRDPLDSIRTIVDRAERSRFLNEVWFENGRYLVGPAGVLVLSVIDTKDDRSARYLICDGGRTNQARESDWASHRVRPLRKANGRMVQTSICGPTCMAHDWVYRGPFPSHVAVGDKLIYQNAGAYHIPWESRFSFGHAAVVLVAEDSIKVIRQPEGPEALVNMWKVG